MATGNGRQRKATKNGTKRRASGTSTAQEIKPSRKRQSGIAATKEAGGPVREIADPFAVKRESLRREWLKRGCLEEFPEKKEPGEGGVDSTHAGDLTRSGGIREKYQGPNRDLKLQLRRLHLAESVMRNVLSPAPWSADLYLRDAAAELVEVVSEIINDRGCGCRLCGGPIPEEDDHGRPLRGHPRLYCCEEHKAWAREERKSGRGGKRAGVYRAAELMRERLRQREEQRNAPGTVKFTYHKGELVDVEYLGKLKK